MTQTTSQQTLEIVRNMGMVRARDLRAKGISPTHLQRLYEKGALQRSGRGVYFFADSELKEKSSH